MGCARDRVKPRHFFKKITQFHQTTGASVSIVTYNQKSKTALRNGISHDNLVHTLRNLIATEQPVRDSQIQPSGENILPPASTTPQRLSTSSTSESISPPSVLCCDEGQSEFGVSDDGVQLVSNLPQPVFTPISSPNLNSNQTVLNQKSYIM